MSSNNNDGNIPLSPSLKAKNTINHDTKVQYTVWIAESWRVLAGAEPSAVLFLEMATMYHTLHVAGRSIEVEETEITAVLDEDNHGSIQRALEYSAYFIVI